MAWDGIKTRMTTVCAWTRQHPRYVEETLSTSTEKEKHATREEEK